MWLYVTGCDCMWLDDWVTEWLSDWMIRWQEALQTIDSMVYFNILMDRMEVSREMSQQPQSSLVWVQMQVAATPGPI